MPLGYRLRRARELHLRRASQQPWNTSIRVLPPGRALRTRPHPLLIGSCILSIAPSLVLLCIVWRRGLVYLPSVLLVHYDPPPKLRDTLSRSPIRGWLTSDCTPAANEKWAVDCRLLQHTCRSHSSNQPLNFRKVIYSVYQLHRFDGRWSSYHSALPDVTRGYGYLANSSCLAIGVAHEPEAS